MQHSRDRIVTSHAGSLPRPDALIAANQARQSGGNVDEARFQTQLQAAVVDVVRRQQELDVSTFFLQLSRRLYELANALLP